MRQGVLVLPLIDCSTWESRPFTSPRPHTRADLGVKGEGELTRGPESREHRMYHFLATALCNLGSAMLECLAWWDGCRKAGRWFNSGTSQLPIEGFESALATIYAIWEHIKGPVMQS